MKKVCSKCEVEKVFGEFYKRTPHSSRIVKSDLQLGAYQTKCKQCYREGIAERRKVPGYQKNVDLKHSFGITLVQYEEMQRSQQNRCGICNTHQNELKRNLAVDHCHSTGKIRGLLCTNCNTALGKLKDSEELIANLLSYLKKYR